MEKGKKMETGKEIFVLDEGMDMKDMAGPRFLCCGAAIFFIRG